MKDFNPDVVYVHQSVIDQVRRQKNDPEVQRRLREDASTREPLTPEQRKTIGLDP